MDNYLLVVADYYKLTSRVNGQYSPDGGKVLIRSKVLVNRNHVEAVNSEYNVNNLHYEIDEEATREYHEVQRPEMMAEREAAKALAKQGEVSTLAAAIQLAANPAPAKPAPKNRRTRQNTRKENRTRIGVKNRFKLGWMRPGLNTTNAPELKNY